MRGVLKIKNTLTDLFKSAGYVHEQAFLQTNGDDPDWPIWYAEILKDKINNLLDTQFSLSNIVYFLIQFENDRRLFLEKNDWPSFYADKMIDKLPLYAKKNEIGKISLYYASFCPYCAVIIDKLKSLKHEIMLRDIYENAGYHQELVNERGKAIVPALKIQLQSDTERWYTEATEIVIFLENLA